MGRGRVELKAIENPITRQVTFGKRKTGLLKKAKEISVMCDSEVALILFSTKGKLFNYATDSRMEQILQRYETCSLAEQLIEDDSESQENWSVEYPKLLCKVKVLQRTISHLLAEDLDKLRLRELQRLEQQLDTALKRIRAKKNLFMNDSISELHKREKTLSDRNRILKKKAKYSAKTQRVDDLEPEQQNQGVSSSSFILPPPPLIIGDRASGTVNGAFECDTTSIFNPNSQYTNPPFHASQCQ